MDNYICKVANRDELLKRWEYLIQIHPGNNKWVEFKNNALKHYDEENTITYLGFLNDEIICEATAYIKDSAFIGDINDFVVDEKGPIKKLLGSSYSGIRI